MATVAQNVKSIGSATSARPTSSAIVSDFALLRLTERYADFLQVGFLGFERSDGTMQDATGHAPASLHGRQPERQQ
jgi:hypothetical protein